MKLRLLLAGVALTLAFAMPLTAADAKKTDAEQNAPSGAADEAQNKPPFLRFVTHDWYFAYPMFCMSAVALGLVCWRLLLNMNVRTNMDEFLPVFQQKLEKEGIQGALNFCRARTDLIPRRLYTAGLENAKQGLAAMRRAMANAVELEIMPDLNFLLAIILAIAKIATMVGLLGTVISMTFTFNEISKAQGQGAASKAGDIGLALYATALGLVTAIPLVFAHVLFKDWIGKYEIRIKSAAQKLLLLVQGTKPATLSGVHKAPSTAAPGDSSITRR